MRGLHIGENKSKTTRMLDLAIHVLACPRNAHIADGSWTFAVVPTPGTAGGRPHRVRATPSRYPLAAEGCEETHAHRLTPTTRDDAHPSYVVALLEGPPEAAEDEAAETNKFSHSGTWENKSVTGQFSSDSPVMVMCARHNSCNAAIKAARSLPKLKMSRENRANGG